MSSSPLTESPTSFHTADQLDNDYQQDINSEVYHNNILLRVLWYIIVGGYLKSSIQVLESPSSTPPADLQFYSDGRPRPVSYEGDEDSKDSFDGGYITATQIPSSRRFADPDQPKLLLAEEAVPPLVDKRPLQDKFGTSNT